MSRLTPIITLMECSRGYSAEEKPGKTGMLCRAPVRIQIVPLGG